jgi:hypothetical protein
MENKRNQSTKWVCKNCKEEYPYEPAYCNDCGTQFIANITFKDASLQKSNPELALEWWSSLPFTSSPQSQMSLAINYNYGDKTVNSLTGSEIEEIWRKETQPNFNAADRDEDRSAAWGFGTGKSNRELALEWWRTIELPRQVLLAKRYFERTALSLTGKEIEEIWRKETQGFEQQANLAGAVVEFKPNQKQFKEFNTELFKQYIEKFSDEDKLKAMKIIFLSQHKKCSPDFISDVIQYCEG